MFSIAQGQIDQFNEDGVLIVDGLIGDETVDKLRACYERLFRGDYETGVTPDEVNWREGTGEPSLTRQICNGWKADRDIADVVLREDLGRAIAALGDWPGTRIMIDNVLWKPSGTRPLGHHQDSTYLDWFAPSDLLSCWIALDDTRADGGAFEFAQGSHKWARGRSQGEFHGPEDYRKHMEMAAAREGVAPEILYVEVRQGGGSFHHGWVWPARATTGPSGRAGLLCCTPCAAIPNTRPAAWARERVPFTADTNASPIMSSMKTISRCCGAMTATARRVSTLISPVEALRE